MQKDGAKRFAISEGAPCAIMSRGSHSVLPGQGPLCTLCPVASVESDPHNTFRVMCTGPLCIPQSCLCCHLRAVHGLCVRAHARVCLCQRLRTPTRNFNRLMRGLHVSLLVKAQDQQATGEHSQSHQQQQQQRVVTGNGQTCEHSPPSPPRTPRNTGQQKLAN